MTVAGVRSVRGVRVRPQAHLEVELEHLGAGARLVAGMDEVGRGALAGPVTVGVVVVAAGTGGCPDGLTDSKLLSPAARLRLEGECRDWAVAWGVGHAQPGEVDEVGITGALRRAGLRALFAAQVDVGPVGVVLLDGSHDWLSRGPDLFSAVDDDDVGGAATALGSAPVRTIVKGDMTCASISAASVLAKCARDRMMVEAAAEFPQYGWESNKGYGAPVHLAALREHGPTRFHRVSWRLP